MQIKDVRPESFVKQIRCDRCGRLSELGEVEFHESVSIDLTAGYASIFGDGNDIQIDLCQHCLARTLGPWLHVSDPAAKQALMQEKLNRFDPVRHGGEFPTTADDSFQKPDALPTQERPALSASLGFSHWPVSLSCFIGHSGYPEQRVERNLRVSTKETIKYRHQSAGQPGFHLYNDLLDGFCSDDESESPVYLCLDGVAATLQTMDSGGVSVTVALPRGVARELGLLPAEAGTSTAADSTR